MGGNMRAWVERTNAFDVFGMSESQLWEQWAYRGGDLTLAQWLERQYKELGRENPQGGWTAEKTPDFRWMAHLIFGSAEEVNCL
jgi:hypothetical protein